MKNNTTNAFFKHFKITHVIVVFSFATLWSPNLFGSAAYSPTSTDSVIHTAKLKNLALSTGWLNLVHYKKDGNGWESQNDAPEFFLSPDGKNDPEAELLATIRALSNPNLSNKDQSAFCKMSGRRVFLTRELGEDKFPKHDCPLFDQFRSAMAAKSVSLIFSSYYLNNPSSAFGHTFLRLNKSAHGQRPSGSELLDYGINYAATVTTSNAAIYLVQGVIGSFKGQFTSLPYYFKVREYNDSESRDLWEYELNLTQDEVDLLVAHLWELGPTWFDYFYFDENCSYHVLAAIEAAAPRYSATDQLPFYVIPVDTVKAAAETPGLLGGYHYRPSVRSVFFARLKSLNDEERESLADILDFDSQTLLQFIEKTNVSRDPSQKSADVKSDYRDDSWIGLKDLTPSETTKARRFWNLSNQSQARVIDAALDYVDFKYYIAISRDKDPAPTKLKDRLTLARTRTKVAYQEFAMPTPEREVPHLSHDSSRLGFEFGHGDRTGLFGRFHFRGALHDLLDDTQGYPEYAQIDFFDLRLRANLGRSQNRLLDGGQPSLWLEELNLFRVISLTDFAPYQRQISWRMRFGGETSRDYECYGCERLVFEVGGGLAKSLWSGSTLFGLLELDTHGSHRFDGTFLRLGGGPVLGFRQLVARDLAFLLESKWSRISHYGWTFKKSHWTFQHKAGLRIQLGQQWSLNSEANHRPDDIEGSLGLLRTF